MQSNCKYAELALANKWIALARIWFEDNAPCSKAKVVNELCPLMPTSIRLGKRLYTQAELVKQAYYRIYGQASIPTAISEPPKRKAVRSSATSKIRQMLRENGTVECKDIAHIKNGARLIQALCDKGEAERVCRGVYIKTDKLK
jgi:hypothetical protein